MPANYEVLCDQCEADLTYTGNCVDYRLALLNQNIPLKGDFATSMALYPCIKRDAYFCSIGCLAAWLTATYPNAMQEYERQEKHRAWLKEKR